MHALQKYAGLLANHAKLTVAIAVDNKFNKLHKHTLSRSAIACAWSATIPKRG